MMSVLDPSDARPGSVGGAMRLDPPAPTGAGPGRVADRVPPEQRGVRASGGRLAPCCQGAGGGGPPTPPPRASPRSGPIPPQLHANITVNVLSALGHSVIE